MKVKITIPVELTDGQNAEITLYAELDSPALLTSETETAVLSIKSPIIEAV